jgi:hypothetical protein
MSKIVDTSTKKKCLACGNDFDVPKGSVDKTKFCSYDCFLSTRKTRQPPTVIICKNCKKEFSVNAGRSKTRQFCGKSCSNSGEFNAAYGKPGSMTGRSPWSKGLTKETDVRLELLGKKISKVIHDQFSLGCRTHSGKSNPNYGHTSETLTSEQRQRYSEAAVKRILAGVSGYKTKHITGIYDALKSAPVKFKSSWELVAMMWWDQCDDVFSYKYESKVFIIEGQRRVIPDFLLCYNNGMQVIIEIKPTALQNTPVISEKLEMTRIAVEKSGLKYELIGNETIDKMKKELGEKFIYEIKKYQSRK